ncbi:MAG: transglutaminase domain-containing protein [Clostridia bacterium]|nr:transglutaminase domain-containing protein [Clostridia bacterium]
MNYDLYTSILVMHDEFRPTDEGVSLAVDFSAPGLNALREQYSLTAIAGDGSAFDRAVRLMDWLTTHVRHNGSCNPEGERGAMTALTFAFDQPEKGVNCAWLATTLTECLLSLRIPARTVYIMPFAPYECDNHVVTEVWTGDAWVMLDPTCNCYARDSQGQPLSVLGLRAALAARQGIAFNDALRYNGQPYSREEHRDYLAKDLCWLRMAEVSGRADSRLVTLSPVGFDPHWHQLLNVQYRLQVQGDQPWLRDWLKWLESSGSNEVFCSPADAALPPREVTAHA